MVLIMNTAPGRHWGKCAVGACRLGETASWRPGAMM